MYELFSKKILGAEKIAVFMHINPDADCVGSSLAVYKYLKNMGKQVDVFLEPGNHLRVNLKVYPNVNVINSNNSSNYDLGICLDCASIDRIGKISSQIFMNKCTDRIFIDHHLYREKIDDSIIDTDSAATGQLLYKIFKEHNETFIDKDVAFCLFGAIVADTGVFAFSSTTAETMVIASKLIEYNIDNKFIIDKIVREKTISEFNLMTKALKGAKFFYNNKMAIITFTADDFAENCLEPYSTEGIINSLIEIDEVVIAVAIAEEKTNSCKISIRTKGTIDASEYARMFGGGGHRNASGCKLPHNSIKCEEIMVKTACSFIKC